MRARVVIPGSFFWILLSGVALMIGGCGDARVRQRYQAERELWRADHFRQDLPLISAGHPGLIKLAQRYENIAGRYHRLEVADSLSREIHGLAARGWLGAADTYLAAMDSLRAITILDQIAPSFEDIGWVTAEIAFRRGKLAKAYGDYSLAIERFQTAVDHVAPDPGAVGVADSVLYLPVQMVQLAALGSDRARRKDLDRWARGYYLSQLGSDSLDVQMKSLLLLAELDLEGARFDQAIEGLATLEQIAVRQNPPKMEPAEIRLRQLEVRIQAWLQSQEELSTVLGLFEQLRQDYADSGVESRALWSLARAARDRGMTDASLRLFSRLRVRYGSAKILPDAMMERIQLLEREQRWRVAYTDYRLLEMEHRLSRAGLRVPLEIALHYQRKGDEVAARDALLRAIDQYRDLSQRYPRGPHTPHLREMLVETFRRLGDYQTAFEVTMALANTSSDQPRGLRMLLNALRIAREELRDPPSADSVLVRIVQGFPQTRTGQWASQELEREVSSPPQR